MVGRVIPEILPCKAFVKNTPFGHSLASHTGAVSTLRTPPSNFTWVSPACTTSPQRSVLAICVAKLLCAVAPLCCSLPKTGCFEKAALEKNQLHKLGAYTRSPAFGTAFAFGSTERSCAANAKLLATCSGGLGFRQGVDWGLNDNYCCKEWLQPLKPPFGFCVGARKLVVERCRPG